MNTGVNISVSVVGQKAKYSADVSAKDKDVVIVGCFLRPDNFIPSFVAYDSATGRFINDYVTRFQLVLPGSYADLPGV